ncbi:hypothetical protein, partial [Nocardia sp. NPDC051570]|uniref:hypothetical protein n=1 Tax=Nocardia sp. NPDC051570 TaxID=3364324 RepID=UPI0037892B12
FGQLIDHKSNIMQHNRIRRSRTESQPRKTRSKGDMGNVLNAYHGGIMKFPSLTFNSEYREGWDAVK